MGRKGNGWDAVPESGFAALKTEPVQYAYLRTRGQARQAIFDYVERCYDLRRRPSTLGHLSPAEFGRQAADRPLSACLSFVFTNTGRRKTEHVEHAVEQATCERIAYPNRKSPPARLG